jgi:3-methyladenine DNA glycosylase AlkD
MKYNQVIQKLKKLRNEENRKAMKRFGINTNKALGISIPNLRKISKEIGKNHRLAKEIWKSGIHEARILSCLIAQSEKLTEKEMDDWVKNFNSWDLCDICCSNLFDKTKFTIKKIKEWIRNEKEFIKRASFALIASLAFHNKEMKNSQFISFLKIIEREVEDERNFVKKSVNWALRQIGKRNKKLNTLAIKTAKGILKNNKSKPAQWIAKDAIRELTSESVLKRLKRI